MNQANDFRLKVMNFYSKNPGLRLKPKQLRLQLNIAQRDYPELRDVVKELAAERELQRFKGNVYGLPQAKSSLLSGRLMVHVKGYGIVALPDGEKIFIGPGDLHGAVSDDLVEIAIIKEGGERKREGIVKKVLERGRGEFLCKLVQVRHKLLAVPFNQTLKRDIIIQDTAGLDIHEGDYAIVKITVWGQAQQRPVGEIIRLVGSEEVPEFDAVMVANQFLIPDLFAKSTLSEAERIEFKISPKGRLDLRNDAIFTIDPEDARDFDDAISLKILENGHYLLGVHIADVSHYVLPDSNIDREALERGTSVYFTRHVIPMLPERLSNEICSLVPGEDRYTFSAMMELSPEGRLLKSEFYSSIIHSKRRFTYEEVQEILDNQKGDFIDELRLMRQFAEKLYQRRYEKGSIDLDIPEPQYELDDDGIPVTITPKKRLWSHRIVEEFMLMANRAVAESIVNAKEELPFVYRIHEEPKEEDARAFFRLLKSMGIALPPDWKNPSPRTFQQMIDSITEPELERFIEKVALRSMMKARYSANPIGHFGLAFEHYTHFTSPIRRYPDLMVHRLLKVYSKSKTEIPWSEPLLEKIAKKNSDAELRALEAEREYHKIKKIKFMEQRIGETYTGIVSGVVQSGFYAELTESLVEGFVSSRTLPPDFYELVQEKYLLKGRRTGLQFRLGDRVTIRVLKVNRRQGFIDFEWLPDENENKKSEKEIKKDKPRNSRRKK
jgi:ribonuclease R